jgi:ATP-binding cassette subfamily F protein 3
MKALLQIRNIHKHYGTNAIFDGASVTLGDMHKTGVIGRNGAGKTTLCRLITGEEELDDGEIIRSSGLRLSYLEQRDPFGPEETVSQFLARHSGKPE